MLSFYSLFHSIAQPIVSKEDLNVYAVEICSNAENVIDKNSFFKTMSNHEIMLFTCSQLELIDKVPDNVKVNINVVSESISDIYFLNKLEEVDTSKLAIEIEYLPPNLNKIDDLIKIILYIKSLGSEVWLRNYRLDEYSSLFLSIPWTGVKIDKEVVWEQMQNFNELEKTIQQCKQGGRLVTLEGIENKYIYNLVKNMSVDFFQGCYWSSEEYRYILH